MLMISKHTISVSRPSTVNKEHNDLNHFFFFFFKSRQNEVIRGVYAPEDVYTFLPTRVGESSALKVNLRNNSFITHMVSLTLLSLKLYASHKAF